MSRVVHFEFNSTDPEKTNQFFGDVFGWSLSKWEGPHEYWLATTGADSVPGINGGIMRSQDGQPRTVNTIGVDSVDEFAEKVTAAGGQVVVPKMAIPGIGWLAYCVEPGGVLFGIYTHDESAK